MMWGSETSGEDSADRNEDLDKYGHCNWCFIGEYVGRMRREGEVRSP